MTNANQTLTARIATRGSRLPIASFFFCCLVASLSGQTATPPSESSSASTTNTTVTTTTTTASTNNDQPVQLSAFEVSDTQNEGYFSSESVSGLKTKQALLDQPGNITVVPRDLITDIGELESASDTLKYVASDVNPYVRGEQMQIRGARTGFTLVDDMPDLMFYADNAGIDSYEVLKGPTAVLYGPAPSIFGLVIKTQKRPLPVQQDDLSVTVGDSGFVRTDLDLTGPIGYGFSYRLIGAYQKQPDKDPVYFDNRQILIGTLQWTDGKTTIRGSYEHANIQYGVANGVTVDNYEVGSQITPYVGPFGRYFNYAPTTFGVYGLYSNDVRFTAIHEFNENWQTRIFYDRTLTDRPSIEQPNMTSYSIVNNTFELGYLDYDENFISTVYGIDNIGKYAFAGIQFQSNFGYLYNDRDGASQTYTYIPNYITGSFTSPPNFNSFTPPPGPPRGKPNNFTPGPSDTYYAMETIDPIPNSDRVIIDGGLSRIKVPGVNGGLSVYQTVYRAGIVVKLTKDISAYSDYATRFNPTAYNNRDINGNLFPNQQGKGAEFGIKGDLFNHRLIITADYYKLENTNVTNYTGMISPITGLGYNVLIGDTVDTGYELDARFQLAKNWQLILVGWKGKDLNSAGIEQDNAMKESAAFFTKYTLSDAPLTWLHGLSIGGGTYYAGNRYFPSTNQYIPDHFVTNAFVEYQYNKHWRASINVQNVFDLWYIEGAWARQIPDYGEPRTIHFTLDHRF